MRTDETAVLQYRRFLETLSPDTLRRLPDLVTADVHFADPFNDVHGVEAMAHVLHDMFEKVADVRFQVRHAARDGDTCLMEWTFSGKLGEKPWQFDGCTVARFTPEGRVREHIDHWDAGRHLHERIPVLGRLVAFVRRKVSAG